MTLMWPDLIWLALALPALVAAYVLLLRRRRRAPLRYASLALLRPALGRAQWLMRHLPALLLLLAIAAAVVAISRPSAVVTLPSEQRTIILAIDVSLSMSATDIAPDRLAAAQAAAREFVRAQPSDVRVGIVSFAGTATVVQPPTDNRDDLIAAIDRLQLDRHTAIGSGIIVSLATLFPERAIDPDQTLINGRRGGPPSAAPPPAADAVAPASFNSAAVILLTDGRRTTGPDPVDAARMAAEHGVRVFTVGFGTSEGAMVSNEGWSVFMRFDEDTLKAIADITQARYFHAGTAAELQQVYQDLNARFVLERRGTEITALFAAAAAALMLAAALVSLTRVNRYA
ncbi:VWA domain-containing protein [Azoarcus indigens]|uniref:Ca-activated chloride channel family protein n=1 Tax=Azoarcus indigens TaxID=29545 RepID=A0A4R6DUS5_9RHOO|nr:VWA domain-containing protein [Azoarcus indigens]NMG65012.1 VWA domain-containing protein [Azoarcus indigens]TDN48907.1 Ca-activated chloride channel family protein [Azoarcus indigens]